MTMPEGEPAKEKLAVISGSFIGDGGWKLSDADKNNKTGIWLDGQLQTRFEEFAKTHDIIDWHVTQEAHSNKWSMFIRYKP